MKTEQKTVELLSLLDSKTNEVRVPKGTTAVYDPANGPCIIKGKLVNEGEITIAGGKTDKVVIVTGEFVNSGKFVNQAHSLTLCTGVIDNQGEIESARSLKLQSTTGKLTLTSNDGSMRAIDEIIMDAPFGINVTAGAFSAPSIRFYAENGRVNVAAETIDGEVEVEAKSAKVGTKAGNLNLGQQRLLAGNHVYYSTGNLSVGSVSHSGDSVVLLSGGTMSVGAITAGDLTIGAGVAFTIDGQYPDPTQDSDADVSWEITSEYGYQALTITGNVNVSGNATIKAWTVEASNDITVGGDLDITTLNENGEVTLEGDIDVDGEATILAYQIDFEGDDFDVDGALTMGTNQNSGYINFVGTFTASDDVTFKCYRVIFDGEDFTMDGQDKTFNANANTRIEATGTIAIDADVETDRAVNLLFFSDGDVKTGSITVDNSTGSWAGAVIIKAYRDGGSTEFIIGGTSNSNGVNGQITTDTVNGGSTEPTSQAHGAVYITNGGDGGITITNEGDISVKGTASKSGGITLNAEDGTITLPAGTLSADGTGSNAGAFIQLLADTIDTEDGTIISASDNGESGKQKLLQIAANTINLSGSSGLTIKADGDGNSAYPTSLQIVPKGSIELDDNDSVESFLYWYTTTSDFWEGSKPVEFAGSGTAALTISSNGSHNRVLASAYPLTFNTDETIIECKGAEDHQIDIIRYQASGSAGLAFSGGDVTIDASGPDSDDGDGGQITINIDYISRSSNGKTTVKADGKGEGDGGRIIFYPGAVTSDLQLGMDDEQFAFSAKGGSTSGNGGQIELWGWTASFDVHDADQVSNPVDVSAPGSDGDGGQIDIVAYGSNGLTFDGTASYLKADAGSSSGNGGRITILASNAPINISTDTEGSVDLSAISNGDDGNGGIIDITCWAGLTVESANLAVTAEGDGVGGTIKLSAGYSTLAIDGNLIADGGDGDSDGGTINLEGGQITLAAGVNTSLSANANGTGNGGEISALTHWAALTIGSDNQELSVNAKSNDSGSGGTINLESDTDIVVNADAINVSAGSNGNGNGGFITIDSDTDITLEGDLAANGVGTGNGGSISILSSGDLTMEDAEVFADGGDDGDGGTIEIKYSSSSSLDIESLSATGGSDTGGDITITNEADAHMEVNVSGFVDTGAVEALDPDGMAGSITLTVSDADVYDITLNITDVSGGIYSILTAYGKEVNITSLSPVQLGIDEVQANDGDVTICTDTSSCTVAISAGVLNEKHHSSKKHFRNSFLDDASKVKVIEFIKAPNGGISISAPILHCDDSPGADKIVILPGDNKPVGLSCNKLILGQNRYLHGSQFANGNISVNSLGSGLDIVLPPNSKAGFKSANNITISATTNSSEALNIDPASVGTSIFSLECDGVCTITANGPIDGSGTRLGYFDPMTGVNDPTVTANEISISSINSYVDLELLTVVAMAKATISTNDATNGDMVVTTVKVGGSTSPGEISIIAAHDLSLKGTVQTPGPIYCEAGGALLAYSTAHLLALNSGGFHAEKITVKAAEDLGFDISATVIAKDEIWIATTSSITKNHPDNSTNRPSEVDVSQISITSPGELYWGDKAALSIDDDNSPIFTANGKDLVFDGNIHGGTIYINADTEFKAGV